MNREIKFRAWDGKQMDYNDIFIRASGNPPIYEGRERPDLTLMQFTGLKDKNGNEIYEGDIVCHDSHRTPRTKPAAVRSPSTRKVITWALGKRANGRNLAKSARFVIIGNIYENPELLK
jgi:hypothetical protein